MAGLLVGGAGLGQVVGDLPAGWLAERAGERRAMVFASLFAVVALVVCLAATTVWVLAAGVAATGLSAAVWGVARQAYVTDVASPEIRARALSTLGGVTRIGMFLGPFLGAGAVAVAGTDGAYAVHLITALLTVVVLHRLPDARAAMGAAASPIGPLRAIRDHAKVLRTLGMGILLIGAVRASRQVVIPLWADHIGLDATTTSLIFGLSGAVDMLLFYPAGYVMDRFGRAHVAVPSMFVLGLSHLLLPLSPTIAPLLAVSLLLGIGNGMGSGIIMTLGADASPAEGRSAFLGAWRLFADAGSIAGPLVISGVTTAVALGPAIAAMGVVGLGAAALLARITPKHR